MEDGNGGGNGKGNGGATTEFRTPRVMRRVGDVAFEAGQITPPDLAQAALAQIHKAFKEGGITPERLAKKLSALLEAKRVVTASHLGEITDEKEYDDPSVQHATVVTCLKAGGFWVERSQVDVNKRQTVILIGGIDRTPVDGREYIDHD